MAMDFNKEVRRAVDTGKVAFGSQEAEKSILKGRAQLVILSGNLPKNSREKVVALADAAGIPVSDFSGTAVELGSVCGKPFGVLILSVLNAGKSKLLSEIKPKAKQ